MALDAGSVGATLKGDFDSRGFIAFDRAMHRAKRSADGFATGLATATAKSNRAMMLMSKGAAVAAGAGIAALAIGIGKAVSVAADFEAQLSSLAAVTKANSRTMAEFKKQALAAGAATKFSALDAAKAQTELAKGGLSVQKILGGGLKGALALAAAGEMDLADAASTTANALNLFRLNGSKAEHVADALATAAITTTADVSDFAMALTQGGAAGKAAGLSFDQTVAALEALATAGVKGSDAGTSLKAALTQLANPTDRQAAAAKALGLNFFDAHEKMKSMPQIAAMLRDRFRDLTDKQKLAAAATIAGTDGMRTLLALADAGGPTLKGYADGLAKQGTAAEVAAKKQDNLKGKIENLKGSLETAAIIVGTELLPIFTKLAVDVTDKINEMAASGDLKKFGEGIAAGIQFAVDAFPVLIQIVEITVRAIKTQLDDVLGWITTFGDTIVLMVKTFNLLPGPDIDTSQLERGIERINRFRESLRDQPPRLQVEVDTENATKALRDVQGTQVEPKIVTVLGDDHNAKRKLRDLIALGIPAKEARVLANVGDALRGVNSVTEAMQRLERWKNMTVTLHRVLTGPDLSRPAGPAGPTGGITGLPPLTQTPRPHAASGRKVSGPELALVGEGGGPEYIIPTESKYRARGIGLLMAAAQDLGVAMFAKGKAPKGKGPRRKVPAKGAYLKLSPEEYDRIVTGDEQLADNKVEKGARKGKLTQDALAARRRLPGERTAARRAHQHARAIEAHEAEAEIARDLMERADRRDDTPGFNRARKRRLQELLHTRRLAQEGLKYARPGSKWARDLRAKLAALGLTVDDARDAEIELDKPETPTFTKPEEARLAELDAQAALAALTEPTADDLVAAGARAAFLEGILSSAILNPAARGGPGAIAEIAGQLKAARDSVTELGKPPDLTADQQAQLEQARRRADTAEAESRFNAQALGVFRGFTDVGASPNITINTLHPGDPRTLAAVGDAATRGQSMQPSVKSSRERLGW